MSETIFLEKCQTYIDCHLQTPHGQAAKRGRTGQLPAVTISRQAGAGGISAANELATWLQARAPKAPCPWTVFHKNLVQKVLEEHNLPARLAQFMPEDKVSGIQDAMEELLGLHPPSWNLIRQTTETILNLAELGHVILVGRGANVITAHLDHMVHVRLVGSASKRAEKIMDLHQIGAKAAEAFIKREDTARARYVRRYFGRDINDPLLYHLTINTDQIGPSDIAALVGPLVLKRYE